MPPALLLVEDDPAIARAAAYALQREAFAVEHVLLLSDARRRLADAGTAWAAVILDLGLPDGNGLDLCRELHAAGGPPVLILSARGEEMDRVLGLELGAEDYLTKPFSPRELCARIRVLLRRRAPAPAAAPAAALLHEDAPGARIRFDGHWLRLTRQEYRLLSALLRRPGRVWSREALLQEAWDARDDPTDRTIDTHVKTLRAKLRECRPELDLIVTHRGLGYSLDLPADAAPRPPGPP